MPEAASVVQEHVTFDGAIGQIEAILTYPEQNEPQDSIFIVGPHPMLGGDFDNNVIRELSTCLAERNTLTLRFNYRGVGQSDGEPILSTDNIAEFWARSRIDQESGFAEDTSAAGQFLADAFGKVSHVVGYSFGAWLGSRWAADATDVASVSLIAPTISQHNYSHCRQLSMPKFVVASVDDFAVPTDQLRQQFDQWSNPKQLVIENVDNHFFRGHEHWLAKMISTFQRGDS